MQLIDSRYVWWFKNGILLGCWRLSHVHRIGIPIILQRFELWFLWTSWNSHFLHGNPICMEIGNLISKNTWEFQVDTQYWVFGNPINFFKYTDFNKSWPTYSMIIQGIFVFFGKITCLFDCTISNEIYCINGFLSMLKPAVFNSEPLVVQSVLIWEKFQS